MQPLGHIELWTDGSTASSPPAALVMGSRAVVREKGSKHVHILVLEGGGEAPSSCASTDPKTNEVVLPMTGEMLSLSLYLKKWRRRHFVLTADALIYFEDVCDEAPRGTVRLGDVLRVGSADEGCEKPNAFKVVTRGRTFVLSCDSAEERAEWQSALAQALRG